MEAVATVTVIDPYRKQGPDDLLTGCRNYRERVVLADALADFLRRSDHRDSVVIAFLYMAGKTG